MWQDHCTLNGWRSIATIGENKPVDCVTIGYLLHEDEDIVILGASINSENESPEALMILKRTITERKRLDHAEDVTM